MTLTYITVAYLVLSLLGCIGIFNMIMLFVTKCNVTRTINVICLVCIVIGIIVAYNNLLI